MGDDILRKIWSFLIQPLFNQRGEVGDEIDELTPEELALLGEDEDEAEELDPDETEEAKAARLEPEAAAETEAKEKAEAEAEAAAEAEAEADPDKDKPKVPQARIDEVTKERGEALNKLELLKTDPDKYYTQYPDEKPAKVKDGEDSDVYAMVVDGGEHHGKTVREISKEDPGAAVELITKYYRQIDLDQRKTEKAETQRTADEDAQKQRDLDETDAFLDTRAEEVHGKKYDALSKEDQAKIEEIGTKTWEWQQKNDAIHYSWADAYTLMTLGEIKAKSSSDGAKRLVDKITQTAVATTSSSKDAGRETGYEADLAMSGDELSDKIEDMSESKFLKWKKDAPKELRDKHPSIDWG